MARLTILEALELEQAEALVNSEAYQVLKSEITAEILNSIQVPATPLEAYKRECQRVGTLEFFDRIEQKAADSRKAKQAAKAKKLRLSLYVEHHPI